MAETIKDMMVADIAATTADISSVLVYKGASVTGTASPLSQSERIDGDGLLRQSDYEWCGSRDDFTGGIPQNRAVVTLAGVKCFVDSITDDEAGLTLRLSRVEDKTSTRGII